MYGVASDLAYFGGGESLGLDHVAGGLHAEAVPGVLGEDGQALVDFGVQGEVRFDGV